MKNSINKISLVIPVFNEEENLQDLYQEVLSALHDEPARWEIVFIDDGSSDRSLKILKEMAAQDDRIRYIAFTRNCGQSAAFAAGFQFATGDVIITMDADLQNDPADIPTMLNAYRHGTDMVIGWRANRQDTFAKRHASKFANWIRNKLSQETVRDTGCSLKIMRADMAKKIAMFKGMHRFLPTLMKLQGASVTEVKVHHRPRAKGISKYGIWDRAFSSAHDLLAVRWMKQRFISYTVEETNVSQE